MPTAFSCTQCGRCCHDLHIPLTILEAKDWLNKGNKLKILTEAIPWVTGVEISEEALLRKSSMTFGSASGTLSIRVLVTLVGFFSGGCPNLDRTQNCTIYESRPLTCRIYPFEMNPKIPLNPKNKLCPPDAWISELDGTEKNHPESFYLIDSVTKSNIEKIYNSSVLEVHQKEQICTALGIQTCSLSNDGYLFHLVDQVKVLEVLNEITANKNLEVDKSKNFIDWLIYTKNTGSLRDISSIGGRGSFPTLSKTSKEEFISL